MVFLCSSNVGTVREGHKEKELSNKRNVGPFSAKIFLKHQHMDLRDSSKWGLEYGVSMEQSGCPEHPKKTVD